MNVVTRQGGNRFLYDASFYGQTASLRASRSDSCRRCRRADKRLRARSTRLHDEPRWSGCARSPVVLRGISIRSRLRQSAGDRLHLPGSPRRTTSLEAHLRLAPAGSWFRATTSSGSMQNNPRSPDLSKPLYACRSVPAITFAHLTHTWSANTVGCPDRTVCLLSGGRT